MQLTFKPVTNRIGDKYLIVPQNDEDGVKCVMCCNEVGAFIVNLLTENRTRDELIALVSAKYPEATEEEVIEAVDGVRTTLKKTVKRGAE